MQSANCAHRNRTDAKPMWRTPLLSVMREFYDLRYRNCQSNVYSVIPAYAVQTTDFSWPTSMPEASGWGRTSYPNEQPET